MMPDFRARAECWFSFTSPRLVCKSGLPRDIGIEICCIKACFVKQQIASGQGGASEDREGSSQRRFWRALPFLAFAAPGRVSLLLVRELCSDGYPFLGLSECQCRDGNDNDKSIDNVSVYNSDIYADIRKELRRHGQRTKG